MTIEVRRLGDNDAQIGAQQFTTSLDNSTGKPKLKFNSDLTLAGAKALVLNISYPGYVPYSRRLDVTAMVFVEVTLTKVSAFNAQSGSFNSLSGISTEGFKVQPADKVTSITIPKSLLPTDTLGIVGELANFDTANPAQAQYFPGNHTDSAGRDVVSVAFDYINLKTDAGKPLSEAVIAGSASGAELVIIERVLPASSCAVLTRLGDADSVRDGFQVPVYSFNSSTGLWDALGQGTLYTAGTPVSAAPTLDCATKSYVLEVAVTGTVFKSQWLNFAFPLAFAQPTSYCATAHVKNIQGDNLAGIHGLVYSQTPGVFSPKYFTTDANGNAQITIQAGQGPEQLAAKLSVVNDGLVTTDFTFSPSCSNPVAQEITVDRARLCQIQGQTLDTSGAVLAGYPVIAESSVKTANTAGLFDFAITDKQGMYWLNVACKREFNVLFFRFNEGYLTVPGINVDAKVEGKEVKDDGQIASLPVTKIAPSLTLISAATYAVNSKALRIQISGSRSNFPIDYTLRVVNAGKVVTTLTGKLTDTSSTGEDTTSWFYTTGDITQTVNLGAGDKFTVEGDLKDVKGTPTQIGFGVQVPVVLLP